MQLIYLYQIPFLLSRKWISASVSSLPIVMNQKATAGRTWKYQDDEEKPSGSGCPPLAPSTESFFGVLPFSSLVNVRKPAWWELLKINGAANMMVLRHPLLNPINNNFDAISWCRVLTLLPGFFWLHVMFLFKSSYCRKLYCSSPSKRDWFILSQIVWQNFFGFILTVSWGTDT